MMNESGVSHLTVKHIQSFETEENKVNDQPVHKFTNSILQKMSFVPQDIEEFDDAVITTIADAGVGEALRVYDEFEKLHEALTKEQSWILKEIEDLNSQLDVLCNKRDINKLQLTSMRRILYPGA